MGESDETVTPAEAARETVEAICQAIDVLPLGWLLIVEGAPVDGGESLAIFQPHEQSVHRALGYLDYARTWFKNDVGHHWRMTSFEDDED